MKHGVSAKQTDFPRNGNVEGIEMLRKARVIKLPRLVLGP